jgi:CDP-diacylglycerol--glycerol-3-phosphate 3-phosphatidyltransferase
MAPFALLAAYYANEKLFFILFTLMLISDVLDGYLARKLHQCTKIGTKLDSMGDYITYISIPFATWWLWPELIKSEAVYITTAFVLFLVPGVIARIRFGEMVAYHTWLTKLTAVVISIGLMLLLFTKEDLLFHLSVYLLFFEALEHLGITFILKRPRSNVKSLWHVLKRTHTKT